MTDPRTPRPTPPAAGPDPRPASEASGPEAPAPQARTSTAPAPKAARPRVASRLLSPWVALLLGVLLGRVACAPGDAAPTGDATATESAPAEATIWTCSMDPQVRLPEPGRCPICLMDLIPLVEDEGDGLGPRDLRLSETAAALADIRVAPVERRALGREIGMVGKVAFDETRLAYITAWVDSRLERLYVDYTGVRVREGDHMAEVYSPDLIATQQQLLAALRSAELLDERGVPAVADRQQGAVESARQRLRSWGLTEAQIDAIAERGEPSRLITIHAPVGGVVVHKDALQGDYVQTGTRIYTIADLSRVWVQLDAYERDLAWVHYGQQVRFTTEAWPGEAFEGRISFIDPVLDPRTRTVKVRLNVDNAEGRLKPDMFVRATVHAPMSSSGRLADPELADLWMCPMHPEAVDAGPAACPTCGMDLVPTAELGFRVAPVGELPLVIPLTAPLLTGERAVVYVRRLQDGGPVFEGREVLLGPRGADGYIVREGLEEGEQVVVQGAFRLDSELQIRAKPSLMNVTPAPPSTPEAFRRELGALAAALSDLGAALAADDPEAVRPRVAPVVERSGGLGGHVLEEPAAALWAPLSVRLGSAAGALSAADDMELWRAALRDVNAVAIEALERFGWLGDGAEPAVFHCPMAFEDGADWIGLGDTVSNPYYGARMLRCGTRERALVREP